MPALRTSCLLLALAAVGHGQLGDPGVGQMPRDHLLLDRADLSCGQGAFKGIRCQYDMLEHLMNLPSLGPGAGG